jgi:hypothetical protein
MATEWAVLDPVRRPNRLCPPPPNPITLTRRPVRPSSIMSMSSPAPIKRPQPAVLAQRSCIRWILAIAGIHTIMNQLATAELRSTHTQAGYQ